MCNMSKGSKQVTVNKNGASVTATKMITTKIKLLLIIILTNKMQIKGSRNAQAFEQQKAESIRACKERREQRSSAVDTFLCSTCGRRWATRILLFRRIDGRLHHYSVLKLAV